MRLRNLIHSKLPFGVCKKTQRGCQGIYGRTSDTIYRKFDIPIYQYLVYRFDTVSNTDHDAERAKNVRYKYIESSTFRYINTWYIISIRYQTLTAMPSGRSTFDTIYRKLNIPIYQYLVYRFDTVSKTNHDAERVSYRPLRC